jgi:hypothetical protein
MFGGTPGGVALARSGREPEPRRNHAPQAGEGHDLGRDGLARSHPGLPARRVGDQMIANTAATRKAR